MILAEIAEAGRQADDTFRPIVYQHQKGWFEVLGEMEQQQLLVVLHRLQESLREL